MKNPILRLGTICHRVLEYVVTSRVLFDEQWREALEEAWTREVAAEIEVPEGSPGEDPESWPGYEVKRARLFKIAARLRAKLIEIPSHQVLTEVKLNGRQSKLRGVADLVIRQPGTHHLVDYKSGRVIDRQTKDVRESYRRQLQLYAVIEKETAGEWPDAAELLPLEGPSVSVSVNPSDCEAVADEAVELLAAYNALVPGEQPATVSSETCPVCPFITRCPAFWGQVSPAWESQVLAVRGTVLAVQTTPLGGVSLAVQIAAGSISKDVINVRNIKPRHHPSAEAVRVGDLVSISGLRLESTRGTFSLSDFGDLARNVP